MDSINKYGTFGYRFQDSSEVPLYQLFAVGCDKVTDYSYSWDGIKRIDGPLYLFQYTVSGCGAIELGGDVFNIPAGTALMADIPGEHRYYLPGTSSHWEFYFILFRQKYLAETWQRIIGELGPLPHFDAGSPVIRILEQLYSEARLGRINDVYQASALVYRFVMELCRSQTAHRKDRGSWPDIVSKAAVHIERNYSRSDLGLDEIASSAGSSKYHLARSFAAATGSTPLAYLTRCRIEHAVDLLRRSGMTVDDVARSAGFANGSYFSKVFRRWTGFTPGEFRKAEEMPSIDRFMFD
ncbi:AraC family transcriptional regulator [Paenibacillus sp. NEAU-GSW1]|uniref:helix-turn-helix transcriptional regulator n=1 Tax=Paenibacillus sp. NEAU-GSW1 TaxID=2682486 RepID=UPI0012E23BC9|nr:AraC family transcriptional regulator [Paenibacillus sp. NEAU-GSW1]MUT67171.1 helix-turn-helix domain-containing protein [Paenibacillus sp. NEAU-GSW1]